MVLKEVRITSDSTSHEIESIARAIHEVVRLPVVMASANKKGIIIEKDKVVDYEYSGPILERVLKENRVVRVVPDSGKYKGIPFIVAPIRNSDGEVTAAIGIVDMYGMIDLAELFGNYPDVVNQVEGCFRKIYGKDVPLISEEELRK
jgi:hypothetical protein